MTNQILIEKMTSADCQNVYDLAMKTPQLWFNEEHPAYFPVESLKKFSQGESCVCLVARVNEEFAGFIIGLLEKDLTVTYLTDMVVDDKYRKLGIGKQLFEHALEGAKAKGCPFVWALVRDTNLKMQRFIELNGFKQAEKFFVYYKSL